MKFCWLFMLLVPVTTSIIGGIAFSDSHRGYVAEWQWEQWPVQQVGNDSREPGSPAARMGSALWYDGTARSWWLFGGRQVKAANTTKLKVYTDLWRYDSRARSWSRVFPSDRLRSNVGGVILLRASLLSDDRVSPLSSSRTSSSKGPSQGVVLCGRRNGKERSLAVYSPRSMRSDTVWQLELKDKQWTAYVCCCDNATPERSTRATPPSAVAPTNATTPITATSTQMHYIADVTTEQTASGNSTARIDDVNRTLSDEQISASNDTKHCPEKRSAPVPTTPPAFCPELSSRKGAETVAWCDTSREQIVALDLGLRPLVLWQFDLKTSHWVQREVKVAEGTLWPGCMKDVRYAGCGSTVYVVCTPYGTKLPTPTRLVYRLEDATSSIATLQGAGQIQLHSVYGTKQGAEMWVDETRTILQAAQDEEGSSSRTLLVIAHDKLLDIWILDPERETSPLHFAPVENIWRGSALKWFHRYDAPLYNLLLAGRTWLLPNPRSVTQYWPRERGRFIVRLTDCPTDREMSDQEHPASDVAPTIVTFSTTSGNPIVQQHHQTQDGIKALAFFAVSLTIFAVFGVSLFFRRCVTCPPSGSMGPGGNNGSGNGLSNSASWPLRPADDSKSTPPVIRYSVIPDDLTYSVA